MPRTLPWLTAAPKQAKSKATAESRRRQDPTTSRKPRIHRAPSTSPPPTPPTQTPMKHGADEEWIMVEDELLAAAKTFTRDMHVAEYEKQQAVATRRSLAGPSKIDRPTDGRTKMSVLQVLRKAGEEHRTRLEDGVDDLGERASKKARFASDVEDSEEEAPIGDRNLAGLMHKGAGARNPERRLLTNLTGPLKDTPSSGSVFGDSASSAVARGLHTKIGSLKATSLALPIDGDSTTDDEDLDVPPKPAYTHVATMVKIESGWSRSDMNSHHSPIRTAAPLRDRSNVQLTAIKAELDESDKEAKPRIIRVFGNSARRTLDHKASTTTTDDTSITLDEIPTFMF